MGLPAGARLGPYEVLAPLGAGGMGEVYRARDSRLGREVAIKIVAGEGAQDPQRRARFEQEARAAAALNHPHILAVHDVGVAEVDGVTTPYVVSELLDGESLRARLTRGAMPPRTAIELGVQIAKGLAAAHDAGIVHRDVKPENLFVTKDGTVKVLDFGLAKLRAEGPVTGDGSTTLGGAAVGTGPGVVLGTVGYMAPEQVRGGAVDGRADIFALGCVLYELLGGRRAFAEASSVETLHAILHSEPPDLTTRVPDVPVGVERIVRRCLAKDATQRFQSARDLAFALEAVSDARSSSAAPAPAAVRATPRRWREGVAWALAALVGTAWLSTVWRPTGAAPAAAPALHVSLALPADTAFGGAVAIAPQGDVVALVLEQDGEPALWLRPIAAAEPTKLDGTQGAAHPFWSPDGRTIAFFASGRLRRMPVTGGPPVDICDVVGQPRGGTWGADDVIVFAREGAGALQRVSAAGGTPVGLAATEDSVRHVFPSFLADGREFLFAAWRGAAGTMSSDVYRGHVDGRPAVLVVRDAVRAQAAAGRLVFQRGTTLLTRSLTTTDEGRVVATNLGADESHSAYSLAGVDRLVYARVSPAAGQTQLTWLGRDGRVLDRIGEPGIWSNVVLSPDGARAILHRVDADRGGRALWMLDVESKRLSRFTTESGRTGRALWSPDGTRILYSLSQPGERARLYERLADGSALPRLLVERPASDVYPDGWSHRGRLVLYATRNSGEGAGAVDLWTRDLAAGTDAAFMATRFTENEADVSRDDRWVAYVSDESGRREVYVAQYAGGARWQVSNGGGRGPRWRQDTRELFYLDPGGALLAVPVAVSGSAPTFGPPVRLFDVDLSGGIPRYDVAKDGARILAAVPVAAPGTTTEIGLVINALDR